MKKCLRDECKTLTKNAKYCSRSCAQRVNNRKPKRVTSFHETVCKYDFCDKIVKSQGKYVRIYCNMDCANKQKSRNTIDKWLSGNHRGMTDGGKTCAWVKPELVRLYGNKCIQCSWNEINPTTGRVPIELDHIDGDWTNSSFSNVRLLCPNCHSLTSTYRFLNSTSQRLARGELEIDSRPRIRTAPRDSYKLYEEI